MFNIFKRKKTRERDYVQLEDGLYKEIFLDEVVKDLDYVDENEVWVKVFNSIYHEDDLLERLKFKFKLYRRPYYDERSQKVCYIYKAGQINI